MLKQFFLLIPLAALIFSGCQPDPVKYQDEAANPERMHRAMKSLSDVIVHNIFSPPVASRCYAYSSIAAWEVMAATNDEYQSLAGQLNELTAVPAAPKDGVDPHLAALEAFMQIGKTLTFSDEEMDKIRTGFHQEFRDMGMSDALVQRSVNYGETVANHILAWSAGDNYAQTRTAPSFDVYPDQPGRWKPTPPEYIEAIEPSWKTIRTFILDSSSQFVPPPATAFDLDKNSQFWKETMEVYDAVKLANKEDSAIAKFWDCNPYVGHVVGHVRYATKKITPGGHWIGIAGIASEKAGADFGKTVQSYALTSIALADAFISCWDEKYRSNLVRPETVINEHFDAEWRPVLQTPPFPEYTSGHSVISRAAAVALTSIYGENFSYRDTVEMEYGLPPREFTSFINASDEAAISRLYGGIHYRPACENGVEQGKKVGDFVVDHIEMRKADGIAKK
ncbi:MAG: vanadium-dependent haloperoxidase [Bacteroidia bacterium]